MVRLLHVEMGWIQDGCYPHCHGELWSALRREAARRCRRSRLRDLLGLLERCDDAVVVWGCPTMAGMMDFWLRDADD